MPKADDGQCVRLPILDRRDAERRSTWHLGIVLMLQCGENP